MIIFPLEIYPLYNMLSKNIMFGVYTFPDIGVHWLWLSVASYSLSAFLPSATSFQVLQIVKNVFEKPYCSITPTIAQTHLRMLKFRFFVSYDKLSTNSKTTQKALCLWIQCATLSRVVIFTNCCEQWYWRNTKGRSDKALNRLLSKALKTDKLKFVNENAKSRKTNLDSFTGLVFKVNEMVRHCDTPRGVVSTVLFTSPVYGCTGVGGASDHTHLSAMSYWRVLTRTKQDQIHIPLFSKLVI